MQLVTAQQMRELDARTINEAGIPGIVLMELAGRGAFDFIVKQGWLQSTADPVLILAGKGNNGGDALVVARCLLLAGYSNVDVLLLADSDVIRGDARTNLACYRQLGGIITEVTTAEEWEQVCPRHRAYRLVVDGILGTGLNSPVRGFYGDVIDRVSRLDGAVVALDIPSGLHADRGVPLGNSVKANATVTFGLGKTGLFGYPGREYAGEIKVIDIGIPPSFLASMQSVELLTVAGCQALMPPTRGKNSHKGTHGHLLTVAGSRGRSGAALMAAFAAMKAGCGLSTLATPSPVAASIEGRVPELMMAPLADDGQGRVGTINLADMTLLWQGKQAIAVGPGLGVHEQVRELVAGMVKHSPVPLVLDADALTVLATDTACLAEKNSPVILTPHPGEMARLLAVTTSKVQENRLQLAKDFACRHGVYLVLKGAGTVVAAPDGTAAINSSGNPLLATAGSGDVLTGTIAGLLARGLSPFSSCRLGVYLHGLAADLLAEQKISQGITAGDLLNALPAASQLLTEQSASPGRPT